MSKEEVKEEKPSKEEVKADDDYYCNGLCPNCCKKTLPCKSEGCTQKREHACYRCAEHKCRCTVCHELCNFGTTNGRSECDLCIKFHKYLCYVTGCNEPVEMDGRAWTTCKKHTGPKKEFYKLRFRVVDLDDDKK